MCQRGGFVRGRSRRARGECVASRCGNARVTPVAQHRRIVSHDSKEAFVIWLEPPASGEGAGDYRGRIEHLASSTREAFSGAQELLAFIERALVQPRSGVASEETGRD